MIQQQLIINSLMASRSACCSPSFSLSLSLSLYLSIYSACSEVRCFWKCTGTSTASLLSSFPSRFQAPSVERQAPLSSAPTNLVFPFLVLTVDVSILPLSIATSPFLVKQASLTVLRLTITYYRHRILDLYSTSLLTVVNFRKFSYSEEASWH